MQSSESSNRLAELMETHDVERPELAALCKRDTTTIGRWISGQVPIPDEAKRLLCERFDCTLEHLLGWDRDESRAVA